jgi:hypothetical protein
VTGRLEKYMTCKVIFDLIVHIHDVCIVFILVHR